jgi:hypothetical protein
MATTGTHAIMEVLFGESVFCAVRAEAILLGFWIYQSLFSKMHIFLIM